MSLVLERVGCNGNKRVQVCDDESKFFNFWELKF